MLKLVKYFVIQLLVILIEFSELLRFNAFIEQRKICFFVIFNQYFCINF